MNSPVFSEVHGLNEALQALYKTGQATEAELKGIMFEAGVIVAKAAIIPVDTGNLAMTLRVGKGRTKSTVSVGNTRTFYASFIHKGAPAKHIRPNPFILEARNRKEPEIKRHVENGISKIIKKNDL